MIIVACPGQGSQTPGFLEPWLERDGVREKLERFSAAADVDLIAHGTTSDADTIRDTRIAQPLIVAASLIAWDALGSAQSSVGGLAGHSVGEFAAIAASGVLSDEEAMRLVGIRGRAMADASAETPTGMSAVLGGDQDAVIARLEELDLTAANFNGGGQIVAAGALDALAALAADPLRGTRVIPLQVAGAFHTRYMASAVSTLRDAIASSTPSNPAYPLWTNSDGSTVPSGSAALDLVVGQVSSPVRWDACMSSFLEHGITGMIELTPAGALVGLAKRALRGVPTVAVKTPEDLPAAVEMLQGA